MAKAKPVDLTKEIGKSGTNIASGQIIGEEYNWKLSGLKGLAIWEEMRSNDATVSTSLEVIKNPILAVDFTLDAASEDEVDIEVRDTVEECLFTIVDWDQFKNEALTYLDFGFSLFEMVFEPRVINGKPRLALVKLAYRKQTTITAWSTEDDQPGVTQTTLGGRFSIPLEKLVRITHKQEGENYSGRSILRPAYKHWYYKDKLYKIDALGHERQATGVLDITTPKTTLPTEKAALQRAARNLRANESSYIMHGEDYSIEFMNMQAQSMKDTEPSINHHDRQIMKNTQAQFLEIGASGSSGTKGASEDHSRLFDMAVQNVANKIVNVLQQTVVKTIVDLNFTDRDYPTLRVGKTSDDNIQVISTAVSTYVTAKALHPRAADENSLRKSIGWAEVDEEELDEIYAKPDPVVPVAVPADKVVPPEVKAAVVDLKALRASVEKALYEPTVKAA